MQDKTILITGASSGIGKATAQLFAQKGANLILIARSEEKLKSFTHELNNKFPNSTTYHHCDLTNLDSIKKVTSQLSKIDTLINNAGIGFPSDLSELSEEDYNKMMDTNVKGLIFLTKEILPIMEKQNKGHIINISSLAGIQSNPVAPIYCASKFALEGYTSGLKQQLEKKNLNIRVSLIRPGGVDTNYWGTRDVPRHLYMSPEEMAHVLHFVVSFPESSNVIDLTMESFRK
jgi:short-subunit dehydrogenase